MLTPYISKSTLIGIELGGGPIRSNTPTYNPLALSKYGPYAENNVHEPYAYRSTHTVRLFSTVRRKERTPIMYTHGPLNWDGVSICALELYAHSL